MSLISCLIFLKTYLPTYLPTLPGLNASLLRRSIKMGNQNFVRKYFGKQNFVRKYLGKKNYPKYKFSKKCVSQKSFGPQTNFARILWINIPILSSLRHRVKCPVWLEKGRGVRNSLRQVCISNLSLLLGLKPFTKFLWFVSWLLYTFPVA